ncbi:mannitol dehydrogenase family protein [Pelagovum pacificum]|uniref:Mannitol dehydrogenase family protein n=1 Tax=Pelagovum pacificum TaxID=2588711 RepID=A0A5C5GA45_9RHOB|nr:mannitol dehydrogenase family protein [Pelagovum pacificum]QQA42573.1 mannitol dehydrogenase family protein [Pelagovum pacificum]TNY31658.1 mannitol dehydrogenase family protein [Pelagovum pacificum]
MSAKLSEATLSDLPDDVGVPGYDRSKLSGGILHVGVGNFHRAHMATYLDRLFRSGKGHEWAIVGAGVRPGDAAMRDRLAGQDWLTTVVDLDPEGFSAQVIGSMTDFIEIDPDQTIARMVDPETKIVSTTITEGGYYVRPDGGFDADHPDMKADAATPDAPKSVFGMVIKALRQRRDAGTPAFTAMSCDNLPENGHVFKQTVTGLARLSDPEFADWITDNVAFPNSMVDCITPATSPRELEMVKEKFGVEDAAPVVCEPFRQWVLEDNFPLGRPALEEVGVEFVDDVAQYELMKLRMLNGGHAAIAYPSALLGHHFVHDAMADPRVSDWLIALEQREIMPTLKPIAGVDYDAYLDKLVERFSNSAVGDTIPRLCLDGSNRQPKFVLPTARARLDAGESVDGLALEVALWCRYCAGTDEAGNEIPPNDDSHAELKALALEAKSNPVAFLGFTQVFGDLGTTPAFADAFDRALRSLWDKGVEETLKGWIAG